MKVLLAIDNSTFSASVIEEVAHRKWSDSTEFVILAVVPICSLPGSTERFLEQRRILVQAAVAKLERKLPGFKIVGEVVDGNATEEILSYATRDNTDLIIMGSHGESGINQRRLGNTVISVVNEAPCSVEVMKPKAIDVSSPSKSKKRTKSAIGKS